jgi:hypothetical protein
VASYIEEQEEKTENIFCNDPVNSPSDSREQTLGRGENSRRTLEAGHYSEQTNHPEIFSLVKKNAFLYPELGFFI